MTATLVLPPPSPLHPLAVAGLLAVAKNVRGALDGRQSAPLVWLRDTPVSLGAARGAV